MKNLDINERIFEVKVRDSGNEAGTKGIEDDGHVHTGGGAGK